MCRAGSVAEVEGYRRTLELVVFLEAALLELRFLVPIPEQNAVGPTLAHRVPEDALELANETSETTEDYVALHSLTQLLNKTLSEPEKEYIVTLLWQIAYADGRLDMYEDSLIHKISAMFYVRRRRVMRLKDEANPKAM